MPRTSIIMVPYSLIETPRPGTIFKTSSRLRAPMFLISSAVMIVAMAGALRSVVWRLVAVTRSCSSKNINNSFLSERLFCAITGSDGASGRSAADTLPFIFRPAIKGRHAINAILFMVCPSFMTMHQINKYLYDYTIITHV